jgi:hypothetical protein
MGERWGHAADEVVGPSVMARGDDTTLIVRQNHNTERVLNKMLCRRIFTLARCLSASLPESDCPSFAFICNFLDG